MQVNVSICSGDMKPYDDVVPVGQKTRTPNGTVMCSKEGALLLCWNGPMQKAPGVHGGDQSFMCNGGYADEMHALCADEALRVMPCIDVKLVELKESQGRRKGNSSRSNESRRNSSNLESGWNSEEQISSCTCELTTFSMRTIMMQIVALWIFLIVVE